MSEDAVQPYRIENERGSYPALLVVDHASNAIPPSYGDLGLDAEARTAHIAWDPGALPVARAMSRLLNAPLFFGTVSRLVLDVNRPVSSATLIPAFSEATQIPGNADLPPGERDRRIATIHAPYHAALADMIAAHTARCRAAGDPMPAVVAIHTFTPVYRGVARPLHVGVLFDRDDRLGRSMLQVLRREPGLRAEENQPYSPADEVYYTLERQALPAGLANVMIEIRNDELRNAAPVAAWGARLAGALTTALGIPPRGGMIEATAGRDTI